MNYLKVIWGTSTDCVGEDYNNSSDHRRLFFTKDDSSSTQNTEHIDSPRRNLINYLLYNKIEVTHKPSVTAGFCPGEVAV